jgi:hypothetical protein
MARIILTIDNDLDTQFRNTIVKRMGMKKGNIQKAAEEAIKMWIEASNKG